MFCRKCGNEMMDGDRYCLRCGFDNLSNLNSIQKDCNSCDHAYSMFDERCVTCRGGSAINGNSYRKQFNSSNYRTNSSRPNTGSVIAWIFIVFFATVIGSFAMVNDIYVPSVSNYNDITTNSNVEITLEEFYQIQNGMTYDEVKNIIGCNGTLMQETEFMGTKSHMFSWEGKTIGSNAVIMFDNGRVMSKTQVGLE